MLHSKDVSEGSFWSFEDAILDDLNEEQMRRIPPGCEHSIAWCIWHIARIEDVTMNVLVADEPQVMIQNNWNTRLKTRIHHTGNAMNREEVVKLSEELDFQALRNYRVAVGCKTREIVPRLESEHLKQKVDPVRLVKVKEIGVVQEAASGIVEYWSKRNIAGLLLMPATRHNLVHLNEALKLKRRRT